ncbi:MAG: hypothetical protein ACLQU3_06305 [Limisphaerales bacterium]
MRIPYLWNAGLLALTAAMLPGPRSEAQEGRPFVAATGPGSEAGPSQRARGIPYRPAMQPSAEIVSAQFQATVYEVQAPAERLGSLDAKALASQAATPEALLSTLAQTGKARLLYHIEQPVNVFSTRITIGASEPVIVGARTTVTGDSVNNISYHNVGLIVRLSARGPPKDENTAAPIVTTAIRLSVLCPGEKEIAPGQKGSATRLMALEGSGALELNQPRVMVAVSSNAYSGFPRSVENSRSPETPITPVGYVVRYQFGPPAPGDGDRAVAGSAGSAALRSPPATKSTTAADTPRSTNTLTAQFQATVYEVEAATNCVPALDMSALARAATPEQLLGALRDAGKPRVLYTIDQPVNVFSDQVMIRTNTTVVTGTRMGADREPVNSYTSHSMGVSVRLSAQAPPENAKREGPDVTVSFNVSAEGPGTTELGLGQMVQSFPMISQEHNEALELGRPRVMLAMGSPSAAEQAKPFVYVIRYQFGPAGSK